MNKVYCYCCCYCYMCARIRIWSCSVTDSCNTVFNTQDKYSHSNKSESKTWQSSFPFSYFFSYNNYFRYNSKRSTQGKVDNTLQESLDETLNCAEPKLTILANTAQYILSYFQNCFPVMIRGTFSIQRHQPMTAVTLKVT